MDPLVLIITSAGLDALVDAQNGDTDPIAVTEIGLSETAFAAAPTLEVLPGEIKRIVGVSGQSVSEAVIHMTGQDSSDEVYDLRGFGLYLADGTLFATYSQADPIFRKVSVATFLLAFDIAFSGNVGGDIVFGDATFLYPPATESVKGVAEIATQGEVDAGEDPSRIVTPLTLATRLAAALATIVSATEELEGVAEIATQAEVDAGADDHRFVTALKLATRLTPIIQAITDETTARGAADAAIEARTITGSGLVSGGGSLAASRVLEVLGASTAEALGEVIGTKALTPATLAGFARSVGQSGYAVIPGTGGLMIQHGRFSATGNAATSVTWPIAFPTACYAAIANGASTDPAVQDNDVSFRAETISATGASAYNNTTTHQASFIAIGR